LANEELIGDDVMHINFTCPDLGLCGGVRVVFELANNLAERGHRVTITAFTSKNSHKWFGRLQADLNFIELSLFERAIRKVILKRKDLDYDVTNSLCRIMPDCDVNIATYCLTAYPVYFSGKGKPFYLVQNYEPWFFRELNLRRQAELTYSLPMTKLTVSKWLQQRVGGVYIGNGVNNKAFRPCAEKEENTVMAFLRGIKWKGDELTIQTLTRLREMHPFKALLVVPSKLNRNALRLRGRFPFELFVKPSDFELARLYSHASVFLSTPKFEGFGLSNLEAMACGTPVVTTDCLGINEYAKNMTNAIVTQNDQSLLANAAMQVLTSSSLRLRLQKNGLATAREYNFTAVVNRLLSALGK